MRRYLTHGFPITWVHGGIKAETEKITAETARSMVEGDTINAIFNFDHAEAVLRELRLTELRQRATAFHLLSGDEVIVASFLGINCDGRAGYDFYRVVISSATCAPIDDVDYYQAAPEIVAAAEAYLRTARPTEGESLL